MADHLHSHRVVVCESAGDADDPRSAPVDLPSGLVAELLAGQALELMVVIVKPPQVRESLVDDVLVAVALVLDDDRRAVLVQPQGIDPASVMAGAVLGRQEPDAEHRLHVGLDQPLQLDLHPYGCPQHLPGLPASHPEDLQVAHEPPHHTLIAGSNNRGQGGIYSRRPMPERVLVEIARGHGLKPAPTGPRQHDPSVVR
ncbi:hypothetical protein [Streptomyces sp. NPDC001880]